MGVGSYRGFLFGESSINLFDENKKLTWKYGDPVKFEMRFAADTNISPIKKNKILFIELQERLRFLSFLVIGVYLI